MIFIKGSKLHININFTIPLLRKYRGGGVAVFRKNKNIIEVLLGLRANRPGKGLWSFPGGGAEGKEKLISAAVREFKEETGVQIYDRYITRKGIFKIRALFFEWNTLVIESSQVINPVLVNGWNTFGEFITLRWVPLSELKNYKLHRWVKNVINFYLSDKMELYVPKPSVYQKARVISKYKKPDVSFKWFEKESNGLFDIAEMVLTKTDPDGTKFFMPKYRRTFNNNRMYKGVKA